MVFDCNYGPNLQKVERVRVMTSGLRENHTTTLNANISQLSNAARIVTLKVFAVSIALWSIGSTDPIVGR